MGRILAIDYGKKRTGLAVSDPLRMIAGGLTTLKSQEVIPFLKQYIEKEQVDLFVLGEPRQMDYSHSENYQRVIAFRQRLKKEFAHIEIVMVDERFTSVLAKQAMLESGIGKMKRQNKELVDEISATIILQTYLESIRI